MRSEKAYYVEEVGSHLDKSEYCVLTTYTGLTVLETETLRGELAKQEAEFHVVKNRILARAASERELPAMDEWLEGQTAIIVGGQNVSEVVKILEKFNKDKNKVAIKGAVFSKELIGVERIDELKNMLTLDQSRSKLLGLLNEPASQLVRLLNQPGTQMVTVLDARARKMEEEGANA